MRHWILSAAYATCDKHALNMLHKLEVDGRIDDRQPNPIVGAEITFYRRDKPTDIPITDAIRAARRQGPPLETVDDSPVDAPALWQAAGEEAY